MAKPESKLTLASKKDDSLSDIQSDTAFQSEDFYRMVEEAAYYRAEKRDFVDGHEMDDWIAAEEEIIASQKENLVA